MEYNKLGNSEILVSKICLGTMTFGEQNTEKDAHEQLDYALTQGINFIDTAELYAVPSTAQNQGLTEKYIGTWLAKSRKRKEIILASKVAGPSPNLTYLRTNMKFNKAQIHEALEGSMKRLQTDYLDLYQLHWPERNTNFFGKLGFKYSSSDPWVDNFEEVVGILNDLVKDGKIRHYGISNETPWGMMRHIHESSKSNRSKVVSIQNPYSLLNRSFEVGLAEMAIRENVGLLAYSPMAFGLLSGKYHKKEDKPSDRINQFKQLSRYNGERSFEATSAYLEIANDAGISLAQMSLAFVNSRPFLTSNIIGATTMAQLKENIESINVNLDDEILQKIDVIHSKYSNPAP